MNAVTEPGTTPQNPIDPTDERAAGHVAEYLASDGREPEVSAPMILITTKGRKSGDWRRTAIFHAPDGDDFVVFASNRAGDEDPQWWLNLLEEPEVWVHSDADLVQTRARPLEGEEREAGWQKLIAVFPNYVEHQQKVQRRIGIAKLERV